jgi:hypothetical protein
VETEEDGLSEHFITQLREQIAMAEDELQIFREQVRDRVAHYAGKGYGANVCDVDTPFNVYNLAIRLYQRRLISGEPRANVRARSLKLRPDAYELSLALEQLFREINLKDTLKEVVNQALHGAGVVKVAVTPKEGHEMLGFLHDGEQPFCDSVLFENFAFDTNAKRWEEIDWCGDQYRLRLDDMKDNPMWDQEAVDQLPQEGSRRDENINRNAENESVERMGVEDAVTRDDLHDYVTVWDVWLPRRGLMVTIADSITTKPLRVTEWDGPENGPYHLLGFDTLPGNVLPVSIGSHLESLANLLNQSVRKLGNQLSRQKLNPTINDIGKNREDANTIQNAKDGDVVVISDPKNIGEIRTGGVDQQSYAFTQGLISWYSWLGGNLDSLGGLASTAETAAQQEMEASGSNGLIEELADKFNVFLKGVMTDLAWYLYTDPIGTREITKKVEGTKWVIAQQWGPERRDKDIRDFEFEVDVYSIQNKTPEQRLQMTLDLIPRAQQLAQAKMAFAQTGIEFDVEAMWEQIVRDTGLTELSSLLTANGQPITAEPSTRLPSSNVGATPREYIRRNVSGGGSPTQGMGQQAEQMMLAAGRDNNGGGAQ